MKTKEIREKADELEKKLLILLNDFQKEVGMCEVNISTNPNLVLIGQDRKVVHHSVKVEVKI